MEVHHHAHTSRKKWTHYFWEFLMLFLAVFCGFLAENQREHYIEKHKARDYALALHRDILADSVLSLQAVSTLNNCINKIDSLIILLGNSSDLKKNVLPIYLSSFYAFIFPAYTPNEATMQQLLNSGALRYFKNHSLIDSISQLNNDIQLFKDFSESSSTFNLEFRKIQARLLEINPLIELARRSNIFETSNANVDSFAYLINPGFLTDDSKLFKEYANWCALKKFYMQNTIARYNIINRRSANVLKILDKVYHIN